jgi:GAF domain-containing protein
VPVFQPELDPALDRWPNFTREAVSLGFRAVHALPMRLRGEVIGALNMFYSEPQQQSLSRQQIGQALADVATIGLLQERAIRRSEALAEQLQTALNSRIVLEQAKGVLFASGAIDMDHAFSTLRAYARQQNLRLADLAADVVSGAAGSGVIAAVLRSTPPQNR